MFIYRRPRVVLFLICSVLSGCTMTHRITNFTQVDSPRFADFNVSKIDPPAPAAIRVVSYNVMLCERLPAVIKILKEAENLKDADFICLQEVDEGALKTLAEATGYNYVYYPSAIHPHSNKNFGTAVLSRWPLKDDQKILLPHAQKDRFHKMQREAVGVTATVKEREMRIYSLHLGVIISAQARREQVEAVLASLPQDPRPAIICGDFNTFADMHIQAIRSAFAHAGFLLATDKVWTYKYWYLFNKKTALDHIFYKGLRLVNSGNVVDRSASDHLPLWAEFDFASQ